MTTRNEWDEEVLLSSGGEALGRLLVLVPS